MEEDISPSVSTAVVSCIRFNLASFDEICKYSINNCPISHPSQLGNPFLGLPLESGRCESCGTVETEKCEGHFGYIELPIPIYHPSHISELKNILSMLCLKCMRVNRGKIKCDTGKEKIFIASCAFCREIEPISVEVKKTNGTVSLELRVSTRYRLREGYWKFLDKFGFRHGEGQVQALHPLEVHRILDGIPEETRKRLSAKGFFPQNGFMIQFLPVPPNCLMLPAISDGKIIMSSDNSRNLLRRVFTSIEKIKTTGSSCSETSEIDLNSLQAAVMRYLDLRGIAKAPHDMHGKLKIGDATQNSSKQWLEKIRTLFISKGSGFSSRSVITGDPYMGVEVIGLPSEIAKRVTFEERVSVYNLERLQKMVNDRLCVAYMDGEMKFSIETSAEGHVKLKIGQIVSRRIMDGDVVFLNRPPSTHKHSLQAFFVALHDENVVKINPLVCSPLGADFDGDCVHIFYPQSLAAKAEAIELFSVEKQLLSSHNALLNMQFAQDSLLSLRLLSNKCFLTKERAQQLSMFVPRAFPPPALVKARSCGPCWTIFQILQCAFPVSHDCAGDSHSIRGSDLQHMDIRKDSIHTSLLEMLSSVLSVKGPKEGLIFFNTVQPLLMEILNTEGFSISLQDFDVPKSILIDMHDNLQQISFLLSKPRTYFNEDSQVEDHLKILKLPIIAFILKSSGIGTLIDSKSESSISKVLQQLGFLGLELFERGKLYSKSLVMDIFSNYLGKHSVDPVHVPSEACGLVKSSFFCGLNPYESFVHSISSREVIVRSSRGLTEPGTLFKNLMATLRDAVICYDGTVRNVCSNSIIQFEYSVKDDPDSQTGSLAGEPVGVLAATAISNPAYKAVLDSSLSTISSWELMKEVLLSKVSYQNIINDRRVVLYLTDCLCGNKFCKEIAAFAVQDCLKKITLRDCATEFFIEYMTQIVPTDSISKAASGLVGHIHLDKARLKQGNRRTEEIIQKCQEILASRKKKKGQLYLKGIILSASECCQQPDDANLSKIPCLQFYFCDQVDKISNESLDRQIQIMANVICPMLLETVVRGDSRIDSANIIWVEPSASSVRNHYRPLKGELVLEVVVAKGSARRNGDAWRTVLDACLPVMHLIDTRRSVPYGIKQVEDLLGISSSFEQAVHRLSTSIRMVAKGVLKEHLILVANSMTCTGSLLGFNNGGFKKLLRSLKVQMPFTEATLFTPIKCLERAAEKCYTDSLTSIVSSCLWGKHVAVGTGSCFKVFWDKQQTSSNQDIEKDVYDFLELVQTTTVKEMDVDDLVYESEYDYQDSPQPGISFQNEAYDDRNDSQLNLENNVALVEKGSNKSNWDKVTETATKLDSWEGWENKKEAVNVDSNLSPHKDGVWSGWENGKAHQPAKYESQTVDIENEAKVVKGWGRSKEPQDTENFGSAYQQNWDSANDNTLGNPAKDAWNTDGAAKNSTGRNNHGNRGTFGGSSDSGKWNKDEAADHVKSAWGSDESEAWKIAKPAWKIDETSKDDTWKNYKHGKAASARPFASDKLNKNEESSHGESDLGSKVEAETLRGPIKPQAGWSIDGRSDTGMWNSNSYENASVERSLDSGKWNEKKGVDHADADRGSYGRSLKVESQAWSSDKPNTVWNTDGTSNTGTGNCHNLEKGSVEMSSESDKWNKNGAADHEDAGWGSRRSNAAAFSGWRSPNVDCSNVENLDEAKAPDNGKPGWKSRAWGSTEGRRNWKNSSRTGIKTDENKGRNAIGTPSGKRNSTPLTQEEEQILFEVDPVFCSAKKILHDASFGEPLSSEDQQFIKEQVWEYHPDKEGKLPGGSIDLIMVDKHYTFTESRCFFIVSADGSRTDFSYIKCFKNFVLLKYPEHGNSFNSKYFRKSSSAATADTPSQQQ